MTKPTNHEPRPRGRPPIAGETQTARVSLRLTQAQREKLDALGGPEWIRDAIERAKAPPKL